MDYKKIANDAMEANKVKAIHVAADGTPFIHENDCRSYCRSKEIEYESFGDLPKEEAPADPELAERITELEAENTTLKDENVALSEKLESAPTAEQVKKLSENITALENENKILEEKLEVLTQEGNQTSQDNIALEEKVKALKAELEKAKKGGN